MVARSLQLYWKTDETLDFLECNYPCRNCFISCWMRFYVSDWTVLRFAHRVIKAFVYLPVQPGGKDETNCRLFFAGKRQNWYIVYICPVSVAYNWATSYISIKVGMFRVTLTYTMYTQNKTTEINFVMTYIFSYYLFPRIFPKTSGHWICDKN